MHFVRDNLDWQEYMQKYHGSWCRFVKDDLRLNVRDEDIILVTGYVTAKQWGIASFQASGQILQFSLRAGVPYGSFDVGAMAANTTYVTPQTRKSRAFYDKASDLDIQMQFAQNSESPNSSPGTEVWCYLTQK